MHHVHAVGGGDQKAHATVGWHRGCGGKRALQLVRQVHAFRKTFEMKVGVAKDHAAEQEHAEQDEDRRQGGFGRGGGGDGFGEGLRGFQNDPDLPGFDDVRQDSKSCWLGANGFKATAREGMTFCRT